MNQDDGSIEMPCYCHNDALVPYCPRHSPLPAMGESLHIDGCSLPGDHDGDCDA